LQHFLKKICLFFVFYNTGVQSQVLSPTVIAVDGNFISNSNGSISYTIGEMVAIETISNQSINLILTQGFQQSDLLSAVPVKLISFTGVRNHDKNILEWVVVNEININQYQIQRSIDGINFFKINNAPARNNYTIVNTYRYTDNLQNTGTNYYRILVDERNGLKWFSWTIKIVGATRNYQIYPIPVESILSIKYYSEKQETKVINLTDLNGKIISSQNVYLNKGHNQIKFDCSFMPSGTYFIVGLDFENKNFIKN